jgi:hypothetical protein
MAETQGEVGQALSLASISVAQRTRPGEPIPTPRGAPVNEVAAASEDRAWQNADFQVLPPEAWISFFHPACL